MEFSTLRHSFSFSINFDAEKAANVIAIAVGKAARNATRYVLSKAIADTQTLVAAERTAKAAIWNTASNTIQVTEAVVAATDARIDAAIDAKVIIPVKQAKTAIEKPIAKGWNATLDVITDYLESTPVQAAQVTESFPVSDLVYFEDAIADHTNIEEVEAIAQENDPTESKSEVNATSLVEEKPQVIDGAIVSSAGVTNTITFDEATLEKGRKATQSLTAMIKEEAAKHSA